MANSTLTREKRENNNHFYIEYGTQEDNKLYPVKTDDDYIMYGGDGADQFKSYYAKPKYRIVVMDLKDDGDTIFIRENTSYEIEMGKDDGGNIKIKKGEWYYDKTRNWKTVVEIIPGEYDGEGLNWESVKSDLEKAKSNQGKYIIFK